MVSTQIKNQKVRITKTHVDKITPPSHGQIFLRDAELNGFALRVTAGSKSFIVEKRIEGRVKRMTLGSYPALTVEQARKEAQKLLGKVASGINPVAEKKAQRIRGTSLSTAYADFLKARKNLSPRTIYDYQRFMETVFEDWKTLPLDHITKDMVSKRHTKIGETSGKGHANLAMRVLRALFNFAMAQYEDEFGNRPLAENPVNRLSQTRAWYAIKPRKTVIKSHQLPAWYQAVIKIKESPETATDDTIPDYLLFILFTGLRREEAASLKWENVDLNDRTLILHDPKNHEPLLLPLSDFVVFLLKARKLKATDEYVFSGEGRRGHLVEPRKQMARVIELSGVKFTIHDLRRTFITIADGLEISPYAVKRLVNHKMNNDVTAGYIVNDVERLRAPMQRITDRMLSLIHTEQQKAA